MYPISTYFFDRRDIPWWFANSTRENIERLASNPGEALWALHLWSWEAEDRALDQKSRLKNELMENVIPQKLIINDWGKELQDIGQADGRSTGELLAIYFHGLTLSLILLGDELGSSVPRVWDFFTAATGDTLNEPARHLRKCGTAVARALEAATLDVYRLQWAIERTGGDSQSATLPQSEMDQSDSKWNDFNTERPAVYKHGPLSGPKTSLNALVAPNSNDTNKTRTINEQYRKGIIWGVMEKRNLYHIWFKSRELYEKAKQRQEAQENIENSI